MCHTYIGGGGFFFLNKENRKRIPDTCSLSQVLIGLVIILKPTESKILLFDNLRVVIFIIFLLPRTFKLKYLSD